MNKLGAQKALAPARLAGDRKPREERWAEILRVAAEVFHEKGYDAATLQDIADRVGILKGSIYYYIKTKRDLLESLLTEVHNEGLAMTRAAASESEGVFTRLAAMIRAHIDYMARNQAKAVVYLHELGGLDRERRDGLFGRHEFRNEYQVIITQGQRDGLLLAELDAKLTAQAMLGCLNSIYPWYRPTYSDSHDVIARHFVHCQLRGIATVEGIRQLEACVD